MAEMKSMIEKLIEKLKEELRLKEEEFATWVSTGVFPSDEKTKKICAEVFTGKDAKYSPIGKAWQLSPAGIIAYMNGISELKATIAKCEAAL